MNTYTYFLCCMLASFMIKTVQSQTYSFTLHSETYSDLSAATSLNNGNTWTSTSTYTNVPLGFTFPFFNQSITKIGVNCNGYADLPDFNYAVNFFLANMKSLGTAGSVRSNISYKTEGSAGSRIFKVEFRNAGLQNSASDSVNVQLWLYETLGRIEMHFGPGAITHTSSYVAPYTGPLVSLENWATNELYYLQGNPGNPVLSVNETSLNALPANGTVYRFRNKQLDTLNTSLNQQYVKNTLKVFPNPAHDLLYLNLPENLRQPTEINISNAAGEIMTHLTITDTHVPVIDIRHFPAGVYCITAVSDMQVFTGRFTTLCP